MPHRVPTAQSDFILVHPYFMAKIGSNHNHKIQTGSYLLNYDEYSLVNANANIKIS